VLVLERGDHAGAGTSSVAAGMLAPISEVLASEQPLMRLGLQSVEAYPDFVAELSEVTGMDTGYLRCGTLLGARDRDDAEWLERERELRETLGLPVQRLRASQARELEPALAPTLRLGLEIPDDHAIDPRKLTAALAQALREAGGELRTGTAVNALTIAHERVSGITLSDGSDVPAGSVVVAAGAWSSSLDGIPEGARIPIHPIKGQILRLHDPAGAGLLTRVLRMTGGYVVPRGDGRYVIGATMEERGFDRSCCATRSSCCRR
jgi:glycine oxidase